MRKLGRSGLEINGFVFGGNVFGWTVDEERAFRLLDGFVDAGFNAIDTADIYPKWAPGNSGGESETIIGKWLRRSGKRDKVLIATKVGMEMSPTRKGLSKAYIFQAVEDSLRRLRTDHIDLYQSHTDDRETPLEETLDAYDQLIGQGKVRAIGASNYNAERLSQALELSARFGYKGYQCLQTLYNLYDREDYERALEPLCIEKNLGVITFFSLASGFLTGKYRTKDDLAKSARGEFVKKYLNERGFRILSALDNAAAQIHSTPSKVALAWMMARPGITAPIVSATSPEQLNELIEAVTLKLDSSLIEMLNRESALIPA